VDLHHTDLWTAGIYGRVPEPGDPNPYRAPGGIPPVAPREHDTPPLLAGLAGGLRRAGEVGPIALAVIAVDAGIQALVATVDERAASLVGAFASTAAVLGTLIAVHQQATGRVVSIPRVVALGWLRLIEGWFTFVLYGLAVLVATLALVLPGLWVVARCAFVLHVVALDRGSLDRAWRLTAGRPLLPIAALQWTSWGLAYVAVAMVAVVVAVGAAVVVPSSIEAGSSPLLTWLGSALLMLPATFCAIALYEPYQRLGAS
jgi:hypothetical protein